MTGPLMARPDDIQARVLRSRLEAVADPVRAAGEAKYLKLERRRVIGASMPGAERVLTGVVQEFGLPADLDMLDALFGASLEEAWCAIWMLAAQPAFNAADLAAHRGVERGARHLGAGRPDLAAARGGPP